MTRNRGRLQLAIAEIAPVLVVAWLVFHGIRGQLLERYLIPSRSMEPVLHGDARRGDVVLVDKTAWWFRRPERFDLVVVRNHSSPDGNHLVKRFIAAGPARVTIEDGDLFLGDFGGPIGERIVKRPFEHPDLCVTSFIIDDPETGDPALAALQPAAERWRVADGAIEVAGAPHGELVAASTILREGTVDRWLPGHLSTAAPIDSSFLSADGERLAGGWVDVRDVGLACDVTLDARSEGLMLVVELLEVPHTIDFAGDGRVTLRRQGEPIGSPLAAMPLPRGRSFRLAYGYLDGHLFAAVDDELALHVPWPVEWSSPRRAVLGHGWQKPPSNLLHLGVVGDGARARITRIRGFHDVHYGAAGNDGFLLEADQIFLLGDNSFDSADSRQATLDPFVVDDLVGAPIAILAPAGRARWL